MESELILKILKFSAVGLIGLVIDFGTTYVLRDKAKANQYVANSIGFSLAVVSNFFLNKYWTFADTNPEILSQFSIVLFISIGGLLINNFIIYLLKKRNIHFYLAKIVAIGVVFIWNFIMNDTFAFA